MVQKYLQSKLSGYIGVALTVIGVIISVAPAVTILIPAQYQQIVGDSITFLGVLKAWLATSPFVTSS
jgi:uncharacterized membrane protein